MTVVVSMRAPAVIRSRNDAGNGSIGSIDFDSLEHKGNAGKHRGTAIDDLRRELRWVEGLLQGDTGTLQEQRHDNVADRVRVGQWNARKVDVGFSMPIASMT